MDEQSFKRLLDDALEPVKNDLAGLKDTVGGLKDTVAGLKDTVAEIKDTQDNRVLPSVIETELTLKSYADSYKINQHNIERIDTRLTTVEENLGIDVSDDLKVPHFVSK